MAPYTKTSQRGLIAGLVSDGWTPAEIEAHPLVSLKIKQIRRWANRFDEEGFEGLETRPKSGRPKVISREDELVIEASLLARPFDTAVQIVQELAPAALPHMRQVYRRLEKARVTNCTAADKIALTPEHMRDRLNFARENVNHPAEYWNNVVFSDEKSFRSDQHCKKKVWRQRGTRYNAANIQETHASGRVTKMYWGAVSGNEGAIALEACPPRMTLLRDTLLPKMDELRGDGPFTLVQDNAPIHNGAPAQDWFTANPRVNKLAWPPKSPDLNIIENIWGMIVRERDCRQERNVPALARHGRHVDEVWATIQNRPNIVRVLAESMPRRLQAVIEAQGGHTHWGVHVCVRLDFLIEVPDNTFGLVQTKYNLAEKHGCLVLAGVVDRDYRGTVMVILTLLVPGKLEIKRGDVIAELVCQNYVQPRVEVVKSLSHTFRETLDMAYNTQFYSPLEIATSSDSETDEDNDATHV